jgi:hypothetical protein
VALQHKPRFPFATEFAILCHWNVSRAVGGQNLEKWETKQNMKKKHTNTNHEKKQRKKKTDNEKKHEGRGRITFKKNA